MISKFYSTMIFNWITKNTEVQQNLRTEHWKKLVLLLLLTAVSIFNFYSYQHSTTMLLARSKYKFYFFVYNCLKGKIYNRKPPLRRVQSQAVILSSFHENHCNGPSDQYLFEWEDWVNWKDSIKATHPLLAGTLAVLYRNLTYMWLLSCSQCILLLLGCCQLLNSQSISPLEKLLEKKKKKKERCLSVFKSQGYNILGFAYQKKSQTKLP